MEPLKHVCLEVRAEFLRALWSRMNEAAHSFLKPADLILRRALSVQELDVEFVLNIRLEINHLDVQLSPHPTCQSQQDERHADAQLCCRRGRGVLIVEPLDLSEPLCKIAAFVFPQVAVRAEFFLEDQVSSKHRGRSAPPLSRLSAPCPCGDSRKACASRSEGSSSGRHVASPPGAVGASCRGTVTSVLQGSREA